MSTCLVDSSICAASDSVAEPGRCAVGVSLALTTPSGGRPLCVPPSARSRVMLCARRGSKGVVPCPSVHMQRLARQREVRLTESLLLSRVGVHQGRDLLG